MRFRNGGWRIAAVAITAVWMGHGAAAQGVVYVKAEATGQQDGTSWDDAYTDLQEALSSGATEIWVAEGVYAPAPPNGDRTATFQLHDGLRLYGGFTGGETNLEDRDPSAYPTILTGDLNGDDGGGTGVNASWYNMGENSYHVITAEGVTATIDGFTIERGWSWESTGNNSAGAGLFVVDSDLTIANCDVRKHMAHLGPGMYAYNSPCTVLNSTWRDSWAVDGRGGAIYHDAVYGSPVTMTIRDSEFLHNTASPGGGPGDAGAIWSGFDAPLDIARCLFEGNEARWRFTYGSYAAGAGAILVFGSGTIISETVFLNNRAHMGGALWIGRDTTVANCLFIGNEAYRQSVGYNQYGGFGGAIYTPSNNASLTLVNSTLHANTARSVGGVWAGSGTVIANSILWTNTSTEAEATLLDQQLGGSPTLINNCIKGLLVAPPGEAPPDPNQFPGAIVSDPIFVDPDGPDNILGNADDDLRLGDGSPCIDAGDNSMLPVWATSDLDGNERPYDDPDTPDTGVGSAPVVDMGAYEFGPWVDYGGNTKPLPSFTYSVDGDTVTFTDTSSDPDGNIVAWSWDFGDHTSSDEQDPVHRYTANGDFVVRLTVRDNGNATAAARQTITMDGYQPPGVSIVAPIAGSTVMNTVTIAISAPDPGNIDEVKFYVDDGYVGKGKVAPFSFEWDTTVISDGAHEITAKAIDFSENETVSEPVPVNVDNATPAIVSTPAPLTCNVGDAFQYDVNATGNPSPTYELRAYPEGMTIDPVTGLIGWTPAPGQLGAHGVTVAATNLHGEDTQSFLVEAVDTSAPAPPPGAGVTAITRDAATLIWDEPVDNVGVDHYQIWFYFKVNRFPGHWRLSIDHVTELSRRIDISPDPSYGLKFMIKAVDAAGNVSASSDLISFWPLSATDVQDTAAQLRNQFTMLDGNYDGLSKTEALAGLAGMTDGMFMQLDANGDAILTFDELLAASVGTPCTAAQVWLDPDYIGNEAGTQAEPFNTLFEAASFVALDGTITATPARYAEPLRLEAPVRIAPPTVP